MQSQAAEEDISQILGDRPLYQFYAEAQRVADTTPPGYGIFGFVSKAVYGEDPILKAHLALKNACDRYALKIKKYELTRNTNATISDQSEQKQSGAAATFEAATRYYNELKDFYDDQARKLQTKSQTLVTDIRITILETTAKRAETAVNFTVSNVQIHEQLKAKQIELTAVTKKIGACGCCGKSALKKQKKALKEDIAGLHEKKKAIERIPNPPEEHKHALLQQRSQMHEDSERLAMLRDDNLRKALEAVSAAQTALNIEEAKNSIPHEKKINEINREIMVICLQLYERMHRYQLALEAGPKKNPNPLLDSCLLGMRNLTSLLEELWCTELDDDAGLKIYEDIPDKNILLDDSLLSNLDTYFPIVQGKLLSHIDEGGVCLPLTLKASPPRSASHNKAISFQLSPSISRLVV